MSEKKAERAEKKLKSKPKKKLFGFGQKKDEDRKGEKKSIGDILETLQTALALIKTLLGTFFGHLCIRVAKFNIRVATPDAAMTAIAYGTVCQAVSAIIALIDQSKNVKGFRRAEVNIQSDFVNDTPSADIKISFSIRVWQILHVALSTLFSLIKHRLDLMKKSTQKPNTKKSKHSK